MATASGPPPRGGPASSESGHVCLSAGTRHVSHVELFVILAVISIYNSWLQNALYCTQKINNRKVSKEKLPFSLISIKVNLV